MTPDEAFEAAREIAATPTVELTQNSLAKEKGIILFNEVMNQVEEAKLVFKYVDPASLRILPNSIQTIFMLHTVPILHHIRMMQNMVKKPDQTDNQQKNPVLAYFIQRQGPQNRSRFSDDIIGTWSSIVESFILTQLRINHGPEEYVSRVRAIEELVHEANETKKQLDSVLSSAQQDLGKRGVGIHSVSFDAQANSYADQANSWKNWSIGLLVGSVLLVLSMLAIILWGLEGKTDSTKIEVGIFGVALVSLISFGLVLCVRNYFAAKHNEIVNRHKANCLGTYDTFVDSADDERKAAVLLQATQTIFSHQRSGYLSKEAEIASPSPILEIVRRLPGSTGGG